MCSLPTLAALSLGLVVTTGCAAAAAEPSSYALHGDDYDRVRGDYVLNDGRVAHVGGTRRHPSIDLGDGTPQALAALSPTEFATADGCMHVAFEAHSNATVTLVRVTRARACEPR